MTIREVMTTHVCTCRASDPVEWVAQLMAERDLGAVPVVEADGTLVGIVTSRDLARAGPARARPADAGELSVMLRELAGPRTHLRAVLHVHDP